MRCDSHRLAVMCLTKTSASKEKLNSVPIKRPFLEYFSQKSANFYNVWCTHMVDTVNSFCNFAFLKFQLSCGITIGYLRCIQFLRETMKI